MTPYKTTEDISSRSMSVQMPANRPKKYVWDYMRGGRNPLSMLMGKYNPSPESLRKAIEVQKLKDALAAAKSHKTVEEKRVAI